MLSSNFIRIVTCKLSHNNPPTLRVGPIVHEKSCEIVPIETVLRRCELCVSVNFIRTVTNKTFHNVSSHCMLGLPHMRKVTRQFELGLGMHEGRCNIVGLPFEQTFIRALLTKGQTLRWANSMDSVWTRPISILWTPDLPNNHTFPPPVFFRFLSSSLRCLASSRPSSFFSFSLKLHSTFICHSSR